MTFSTLMRRTPVGMAQRHPDHSTNAGATGRLGIADFPPICLLPSFDW
jgi:hypothetical protein